MQSLVFVGVLCVALVFVVGLPLLSLVPVPWLHHAVLFLEAPSIGSAYDKAYREFFALAGTISVALWIGTFAIVALSKYTAPTDASDPPRFIQRLELTFDVAYSSWLSMAFANVSACLFIATAISLLMLIPNLWSGAFRCALLVVELLTLIVTNSVLTYVNERFDLLRAAFAKVHAKADEFKRVVTAWSEAKAARLGAQAVSPENLARADRMNSLILRAIRSNRQMDRISSALWDSLFSKGISPFGISTYLAWIGAALPVMFPKPAFACLAALVLMFAGIILILNFAQTVMLRIPDALASYDRKR